MEAILFLEMFALVIWEVNAYEPAFKLAYNGERKFIILSFPWYFALCN